MGVQDRLRAIAVLERTLRGHTFAECSREFQVSRSRCEQLARLAVQFLVTLPHMRISTVSKHEWYNARDRLKHREFWLELIDKSKCHPRARLPARGFGPTTERSIATKVGRAYGLTGPEVVSLATEFEAELLASAESPGAANGLPGERAKKRDRPKARQS